MIHSHMSGDPFAAEAAVLKTKLLPVPAAEFQDFSSPAARCMALAAEFATKITPDERLREMNFGAWKKTPLVRLATC